MTRSALAAIPDDELLRRLAEILSASRRVEADLVAHIAEVDARRLYARQAAPSMFAYCTEALHLSEAEAYLRITVARVSRAHPSVLALLRDGRLHLTGIALLAAHLTAANERGLLARCVHKTKRQIEEVLAALAPKPDAPSLIRRLPGPLAPSTSRPEAKNEETTADPIERKEAPGVEALVDGPRLPAELRPDGVVAARCGGTPAASIEPLAIGRFKVQFTASEELRDKLDRLRSLSRAAVPDGDLAALIELAVTEKLQRLEIRRYGAVERPRSTLKPDAGTAASRHVPAAVRRAVAERDGLRCGFVGVGGRRCSERDRLEYHHRHPWAMGGRHDPTNIGLLCRTHNAWMAEHDYGPRMARRGAG